MGMNKRKEVCGRNVCCTRDESKRMRRQWYRNQVAKLRLRKGSRQRDGQYGAGGFNNNAIEGRGGPKIHDIYADSPTQQARKGLGPEKKKRPY